MEQLLYFILFLIFFIGPGLRKLFEGTAGNNNKNQRSREEIKRYLERMRQLQEQQGQNKPTPASYLQNQSSKAKPDFRDSLVMKNYEDGKHVSVAESVDEHITRHVNEHLGEATETANANVAAKSGELKVQELILNNKNYNDLQKAFLLGEIFNKPKALADIQDI